MPTPQRLTRSLLNAFRPFNVTVPSIVVLALGTAVVAGLFSLLDGVLLKPLPYPSAERLYRLGHSAPSAGLEDAGQCEATFVHYRRRSRQFDSFALYQTALVNLTEGGEPERVAALVASPALFPMLGAAAVKGRLFQPQDEKPSSPSLVVLSSELWKRRFGADPAIVGRMIEINRRPRRVVGVLAPGFGFPQAGMQVFMNFRLDESAPAFGDFYIEAVARVRPEVSPREAEQELQGLLGSLGETTPAAAAAELRGLRLEAEVTPLKDFFVSDFSASLWTFFSVGCLLMLIVLANVVGMFIVKSEESRPVMAVRLALGASPASLFRLHLRTSLLVSLAATFLGIVAASAWVRFVSRSGMLGIARLEEVAVDARVMLFGAAIGVGAALLVALLSFSIPGREALASTLRTDNRCLSQSGGRSRLRQVVVATQIALAVMMVMGSALLLKSFWNLSQVDPGFRGEGVYTVHVALPFRSYRRYEDAWRFYQDLLGRIRSLPGVEEAGAVDLLPLAKRAAEGASGVYVAQGRPAKAARRVHIRLATPGYFRAMGIRLVEGQLPEQNASAGDSYPAILSRSLAARLFPGADPLGRRIQPADAGADLVTLTVTAVVEDVHLRSLSLQAEETLYLPLLDRLGGAYVPRSMTLAVRTSLPASSLANPVRQAVWEIDDKLPLSESQTMERVLSQSTARKRFAVTLMAGAALASLLLGAIGLYGLLSYATARRSHEFGVRMALGASRRDVVWMVARQGGALAGVGLVLGGSISMAGSRFLRSLLYEVEPADPWLLLVTAALLAAVCAVACYWPARRVAGLSPTRALSSQ